MIKTSLRDSTGVTRLLLSKERGNTALRCTPRAQAAPSQLPTTNLTHHHTPHTVPPSLFLLSLAAQISDFEPPTHPPPNTPHPRPYQLLPTPHPVPPSLLLLSLAAQISDYEPPTHPPSNTPHPRPYQLLPWPLQHSLTSKPPPPCLPGGKDCSPHQEELPDEPTATHHTLHTHHPHSHEEPSYLTLYQPHLINQDLTCYQDHHHDLPLLHQPHLLPCFGGAGMTNVAEPTPSTPGSADTVEESGHSGDMGTECTEPTHPPPRCPTLWICFVFILCEGGGELYLSFR